MFDYLVPGHFERFDPRISQGVTNPGGGVRTKIFSVLKALSEQGVNLRTSVSSLRNHFVLVEPIVFQNRDYPFLNEFASYSGVKVLYSTEMHPLKWVGNFRDNVIREFDYVTYCCEFQRKLWDAMGIKNIHLLTDPIDTDLFIPLEKRLQVIAVGRISSIKNSEFIRDLFAKLQPIKGVSTCYVGGASLWGGQLRSDVMLELEIRNVVDVFVENCPQSVLAGYFGQSSFFVANNFHETFSESQAEALSAGCVSVCGGHPLFSERPGFFTKSGVDATFSVLESVTEGFTRLPESDLFDRSRAWAIENVGFNAFNRQLSAVLSEWLEVDTDGYVTNHSVYR